MTKRWNTVPTWTQRWEDTSQGMLAPEHAASLLWSTTPRSWLGIPFKALSTQDHPSPTYSQAWEEGIWEKEPRSITGRGHKLRREPLRSVTNQRGAWVSLDSRCSVVLSTPHRRVMQPECPQASPALGYKWGHTSIYTCNLLAQTPSLGHKISCWNRET